MDFEHSIFLDDEHECNAKSQPDPFDRDMPSYKKIILKLFAISEQHPNYRKYLECENDILFEKIRHINSKMWFIIHPYSLASSIWEFLMCAVYSFDLMAMQYLHPEWNWNSHVGKVTFIFMMLNLAKQFVTAYIDKVNLITIFDVQLISKRYLKTWFVLDFIGAFPFNEIMSYFIDPYISSDTRIRLSALTLLQLLQLRLYIRSLDLSVKYLRMSRALEVGALFVVYSVMFVLWSARIVAMVPFIVHATNLRNVKESWLNKQHGKLIPLEKGGWTQNHLANMRVLYMILGMGYGYDWPETAEDGYICMCVIFLGRLYFSLSIEMALGISDWLLSPQMQFRMLMGRIRGFMKHRNLPQFTREKVRMYCEQRLGGAAFEEERLLSLLSHSLREELRAHEYRHLISGSKLLCLLPPLVAIRLVTSLHMDVFLPNELVIRQGTYGDAIFLISRGEVAVVTITGIELKHFYDGDFFGEAEFFGNEKRLANVVTVEVSEIYRLNRPEFNRYIRPYKEALNILLKEAYKRKANSERVQKLLQLAANKGIMRNTTATLRPSVPDANSRPDRRG